MLLMGNNLNCYYNPEFLNLFKIYRNEPDIIELLVEKGAQLDSQNNGGMTAVHSAVCCQYTDCLLLLIKLGCDVNLEVFLI